MLSLFITAFLLGLIFNAAPGAIFAETVREGVRGGYKSALAVQMGSLVGDALWALLGLVGIGLLLQIEVIRLPVGIAGVLYLLWLSYDSWRTASEEFSLGEPDKSPNVKKALRSGMLLSITNPHNVAYWAAIGSAMGAVGVQNPQAYDYFIFFSGFMVSSVLWTFVCAAIVDRVFRSASKRWAKFTYRACAIAFLLLALSSIRNLWETASASSSVGNNISEAVIESNSSRYL